MMQDVEECVTAPTKGARGIVPSAGAETVGVVGLKRMTSDELKTGRLEIA